MVDPEYANLVNELIKRFSFGKVFGLPEMSQRQKLARQQLGRVLRMAETLRLAYIKSLIDKNDARVSSDANPVRHVKSMVLATKDVQNAQ